MSENNALEKAVWAALEIEERINLHSYPLKIKAEGNVVTLTGLAEHIAAKRRAALVASGVPGVREVIDLVGVEPAESMGEDEVLQHVRDALLEEPTLSSHKLVTVNKKEETTVEQDPADAVGEIIVTVDEPGRRVVLGGSVNSLGHRRMAELLSWWVAGSTDVANDLAVEPPEEDNDAEILDSVELALEKDHVVNTDNITLGCKDGVITFSGGIPTGRQKFLAECDAWYINGVKDVHNDELLPVDPA